MSQTDPVAELLTRIRNAARARYSSVEVPHSRLKEAFCKVLASEGFLAGVEAQGEGSRKKLLLRLRYSSAREPVIHGLRRLSRPGLRRYAGVSSMPKPPGQLGALVLSTPMGLMTDREARRRKVGGELLAAVW
jgi:small subunit ribosomal protein S8